MAEFDARRYGRLCGELIEAAPPVELLPGRPNTAVKAMLEALRPEAIGEGQDIVDREMAACCVSGLWLLHNFLDESHTISQNINSPEGSYWHGIMHRREPDYSNAKYWFRQVGTHPIFAPLSDRARELASETTDVHAALLAHQQRWDPMAFVDLCAAVNTSRSPARDLTEQVAQQEWRLLFDYCYQRAVGTA